VISTAVHIFMRTLLHNGEMSVSLKMIARVCALAGFPFLIAAGTAGVHPRLSLAAKILISSAIALQIAHKWTE
jgi:hypothetical protein